MNAMRNNLIKFRNFLRRAFWEHPDKEFIIPEDKITPYIQQNRNIINNIPNWIDERAWSESIFNYGVHKHLWEVLSKPINDETTYSDIITYLAGTYFDKANYLEIGVSVGKNIMQVINAPVNFNEIVGFEIEKINPVLANELDFISEEKWIDKGREMPYIEVAEKDSTMSIFKNKKGVTVKYLSANLWLEENWEKLAQSGEKFNIIFSDADHNPKAILHEFEMFNKYNLLADKFVIVWDDINGLMDNAFRIIHRQNKDRHNILEYKLIRVGGWLGNNYPTKHHVGIMANFKFN